MYRDYCCILIRLNSSLDEYPAGDTGELDLNFSVRYQLLPLFIVLARHAGKRLQSLLRITCKITKSRRVQRARFITSGNPARKSILIHAAVHSDLYPDKISFRIRPCLRNCKRDSAWLRHSESRLHVIINELCKFVHCSLLLILFHFPIATSWHLPVKS